MQPTARVLSTEAAASRQRPATLVATAALAALLGLAVVFVAGHAQSDALHQAAHDVRHSTGFPCH